MTRIFVKLVWTNCLSFSNAGLLLLQGKVLGITTLSEHSRSLVLWLANQTPSLGKQRNRERSHSAVLTETIGRSSAVDCHLTTVCFVVKRIIMESPSVRNRFQIWHTRVETDAVSALLHGSSRNPSPVSRLPLTTPRIRSNICQKVGRSFCYVTSLCLSKWSCRSNWKPLTL